MSWWQRHFGRRTRGRIVARLRRGRQSVEELAGALDLTDNAVRAQLAVLERDGVVIAAGVRRDGSVGKPATEYTIAPDADSLFSSAYAPALAAVVAALEDRMTEKELKSVMRDAGRRLAPPSAHPASFDARVRAAAALLAELGADADLARTPDGYAIRGHGCPLSRAVAVCPATCQAVGQLIRETTNARVVERCDHGPRPSCHFEISRIDRAS